MPAMSSLPGSQPNREAALHDVRGVRPNAQLLEPTQDSGVALHPTEARDFDVVLFDWPQGEETRDMRKLGSPLGQREHWNRPTVLLGSAGLNLAVAWKLKGGSGCTCMNPLAYDLREHEIFERPFKIDRSSMISIPTPADFQEELKGV